MRNQGIKRNIPWGEVIGVGMCILGVLMFLSIFWLNALVGIEEEFGVALGATGFALFLAGLFVFEEF